MSSISEVIAEDYRGGKIQPNVNNKYSRARKKMYEDIKNATGENPDSELDYSLQIIEKDAPQVQRYVMSQGEIPSENLVQLINQAYGLRCNQVQAIAQALDVSEPEAQVLLEQDESDDSELESSASDNYLGGLFAAIGVAHSRLQMKARKADNYGDQSTQGATVGGLGSILTGAVQIASSKISSGDLVRAAKNKPAGIFGALGQGGTAHYNALRVYFQKNPTVAQQVIKGQITDESQLPNWYSNLPAGATPINSNDIVTGVANYQKQQMIKQYIPYIIGGIVLVILIIVIAKYAKNRS